MTVLWLERNALLGLATAGLLTLTFFLAVSLLFGPVSVAGAIVLGSSIGYGTIHCWIRTKPSPSHPVWKSVKPVIAELEQVRGRVQKHAENLKIVVSEDVVAKRVARAEQSVDDAELYVLRGLDRNYLGAGFVAQCEHIAMSIVNGDGPHVA